MIDDSIKKRLRGYFDEACQELKIIDSTAYDFQFEKIGQRFATEENSAELAGNVLYINEDWIESILKNKDEVDLRFIMYHEVRHIYQRSVIDDFDKRGKSCELPATIEAWKRDLAGYVRNEGDAKSQMANISQSIEIDANAFANSMLIKHGLDARVPEGQEDIMKKRIGEIVKRLWNATIE